jgi:phosphohistidine phosphatase
MRKSKPRAAQGRMARMIELYVVRHAEAEDPPPGMRDAQRRLTEKGRRDFTRAAQGLAVLEVGLDTILTSPLVRARETAEILAKELGGPEPRLEDDLAPGGSLEALLRGLRDQGSRIAVVGHEPGLGHLVSLAASGRVTGGTPLRKGGVARLDFPGAPQPGAAVLSWLLTCKQLRRLR